MYDRYSAEDRTKVSRQNTEGEESNGGFEQHTKNEEGIRFVLKVLSLLDLGLCFSASETL